MKVRIFLLGALFAADLKVQCAEESLTTLKVGTNTFAGVTVTSVTATDVYFRHSGGLGNAKLKDLEPALQKNFNFDPAQAATSQARQDQAKALYAKALRDAPPPKRPPPEPGPQPTPQPVAADAVPPHPISAKSFLGQRAPDLGVEKWLTDAPDMTGKFVLVDMWATWCAPCRQAIPHLNALHARFKDRLVVIGLSNETEDAVRRMAQPKMDYSVAVDTQRRMHGAVEVRGIPHAMLIDPEGIVRFEGMPHYLTERSLAALMKR